MSLKAKLEAIIYAAETPVTLDQLIELVKESVISEGAVGGTDEPRVASQVPGPCTERFEQLRHGPGRELAPDGLPVQVRR